MFNVIYIFRVPRKNVDEFLRVQNQEITNLIDIHRVLREEFESII